MPRSVILLTCLAALALISPVRLQAWELGPQGLHRIRLPSNSLRIPRLTRADLDSDGLPEALGLSSGRLLIQSQGETRWSSPASWDVQQVMIADLNRDQVPEAVLLVSRPFQPWPVDAWLPRGGRIDAFHDAHGYSSHIILVGWKGASYGEFWAGSALAEPVRQFAAASLDGAGQLLVTLEGEYDDPPSMPARRLKVWDWNGFGFGLVSALEGPFSRMAISQDGDRQILILVR